MQIWGKRVLTDRKVDPTVRQEGTKHVSGQRRGQYGWSSGGQDAITGKTKARYSLEDFMF